MSDRTGAAGKIAGFFIESKLTPLIIIASMLLGAAAVIALPREEEPQIIVPMIDIFVQMPGASAREVEQRVTKPMEKLLWEIPGVEYIYSTSSPGMCLVIVRFFVGQNEEQAIVRLQSKLMANYDRIPPTVSPPLVKPRYIDDVPILAVTLWSNEMDSYSLKRIAAEIEDSIKQEPNVSVTGIIGGERRTLEVQLNSARLAAYGLESGDIHRALEAANSEMQAGSYPSVTEGQVLVQVGGFLKTEQDVGGVVVSTHGGNPVYLRDVAKITDGPAEPDQYVFFGVGPAFEGLQATLSQRSFTGIYPAVTLTVAKRKGTNAITVAENVLQRIDGARGTIISENVHLTITRHYGETSKEKSDELLFHMLVAVFSVTVLIGFALGHRESGVVALAIPVTLALTLAVFFLYGYTLNRITLFALIFSIGILVDDAIVIVENIVRHFRMNENRTRSPLNVAVEAVDEVGNPTILATLTVIAAILPMAFVGGLMGPYMRPIPVGASAAMVFSLIVAFLVTPWASVQLIRQPRGTETAGNALHDKEDRATRLYRRTMDPLIHHAAGRWLFLIGMFTLLLAACALVGFGKVRVKMLPFDNKSEFQVIIDMPESATLEETAAAAIEMGEYLKTVNEVTDYEIYVGTSGPYNFNGLVRHYYLRRNPGMADIQVNLAGRKRRRAQSHEIAKRVRPFLKAIADRHGGRIKVAEVPPGPPVLSTLVAEIYGPDDDRQRELALKVREIFEQTEDVVDVDWYMEDDQKKYLLTVDQEKSALHGIEVSRISRALSSALQGSKAGLLHQPLEKEDVLITLRAPLELRASIDRL
jgi:multidrug efflux pump subunit AcrB